MGFAAYGGALHGLAFRRAVTAFRAQSRRWQAVSKDKALGALIP